MSTPNPTPAEHVDDHDHAVSRPNPTHIIARGLALASDDACFDREPDDDSPSDAEDREYWMKLAHASVSKLTDAGYSIMPTFDVGIPNRHRGIEPDTEMGGVVCSECGWHLSGRTVDNDTQERHHREHSAAAEGETNG